MTRAFWLAALTALTAATIVGAPAARAGDLDAAVPGHPGLTAFDLVKTLAPDLTRNANGSATTHKLIPLRHLEGKDSYVDLSAELNITSADVYPVPGDPSRVIVTSDLGEVEGYVAQPSVMALISLTPTPRLVDAVEVGSDRWVAVSIDAKRNAAPGAPVIMVESEHDNSNQSYLSTAIAVVHHDRFAWVDTLFTFSEAYCAFRRTQQPFVTTTKSHGAYADIHVRVEEITDRTGDDCGDDVKPVEPGKREVTGVWRWNPRKGEYQGGSKALEKLQKEDQARF